MEIIILYGFICSGKSTIAKVYEKDGYTVVSYDDEEENFFANLKETIEYKEKIVIDAPIWNVNNLAAYSALCGHYGVHPTNVKVHVLPHLELNEVLSRFQNRWNTDNEHINHDHFKKGLDQGLNEIKLRYMNEYQKIVLYNT